MDSKNLVFRIVSVVSGMSLLAVSIAVIWTNTHDSTPNTIDDASLAGIMAIVGIVVILLGEIGHRLRRIEYKDFALELTVLHTGIGMAEKRELESSRQSAMDDYPPATKALPGEGAPPFELLQQPLVTRPFPCADPMTPMYLLDPHFRILDWNEAFSLAFDYTMEGRRGQPVLEWVYFLENYKQVIKNGIRNFSEPDRHPVIDVEPIQFKGKHYGRIEGTKRAYPIPDDKGACSGWLVTIELEFSEKSGRIAYYIDLFAQLKQSLVWSEYSLTYDRILNHTEIYPGLLHTLTEGTAADLHPVPEGARVLDLGAGTGNLTRLLATPEHRRLIVAMDNNPMMLNLMRHKLGKLLKQENEETGVITVKQDISSLFGLYAGWFDVVFTNNVLYSMPDDAVRRCLREVHRVLKDGGEFRMGGPTERTRLDKVFRQIKSDLKKKGVFADYETAYNAVRNINYNYLQPMLTRRTFEQICGMIRDAGFVIDSYDNKVYAGQAVVIFAHKKSQPGQATGSVWPPVANVA